MPSPGGYWLTPSRDRLLGGLEHLGRPVVVGEALPRLIAPVLAASADISAKIVGRSAPSSSSSIAPRAARVQEPGTVVDSCHGTGWGVGMLWTSSHAPYAGSFYGRRMRTAVCSDGTRIHPHRRGAARVRAARIDAATPRSGAELARRCSRRTRRRWRRRRRRMRRTWRCANAVGAGGGNDPERYRDVTYRRVRWSRRSSRPRLCGVEGIGR